MRGEHPGKGLGIRPIGGIRHADQMRPVCAQQRLKIEIAWVVDQHRVARLQQEPAQKVDGLGAAFRQHDLVGRCIYPAVGKTSRYQLPQRRQTKRRTIFGKR